jgi:RNA polymerase sigma factor (sigma-70 family)
MSPDPDALEPIPYTPGSTTLWNNSWRHIYDHFANAIVVYACRRGLNEHSAQDVLQEVMATLIRCQHGQEAGYDRKGGAFQAWLWGVIKNRVRSVRRKDDKEEPASPLRNTGAEEEDRAALPETPQPPPDFEKMEEDEWQRALLAAALRKVQERVTPENFAIYTALLEEKASSEQLAQTYNKEPNAIYAVKHRCEKMVITEARTIRDAWAALRQQPSK